jgi:signal transduction histidine kinase
MEGFPKIDSSEYTDLTRVIKWFILLRWIAALGVCVTLLLIQLVFGYALPYAVLYSLNGALLLVNGLYAVYFFSVKYRNLLRNEIRLFLHIQICSDYILLFLLLYFSGFLENPFSYFFVFHIMLTSYIFASGITYRYIFILTACILAAAAGEHFSLLPHYALSAAPFSAYRELIPQRVLGLAATLVICAYLTTTIKARLEEKGRKTEIELNKYRDLDAVKSNFILQVTHELRGPIAALKGYHEMILKGITGKISPRTGETLRKADHRTVNLLAIIDEMIDYAYMQSGDTLRNDKSPVNLAPVIEYNLETYEHLADGKKVRIKTTYPKELYVYANRDLLNIIIANLLTNAIKYSREKGTIFLNGEKMDAMAHILVKDEGIGIKPEEMENIFEEFYRTRQAREIERDGTGLGLPLVKRAVEALDGRISVYSEEGRGSSFHVYIPLAPSPAKEQQNGR